ncbi:DUF736 family protein [Cupriavidus necator]|uniref:DUF736 family protein n=1 Tax=Cupriavidus necator TaxID=106590 RepID=UPI003F736F24
MELGKPDTPPATAGERGLHRNGRTVTLNVKASSPTTRLATSPPIYRIQAAGAAWKEISQSERPYLSVTVDPSFPATINARLIKEEHSTRNLIWSRSKPAA